MANEKDEYIAPGIHSRPLVVYPSLCPHTFELQSMRNTIDELRARLATAQETINSQASVIEMLTDDRAE
jgi:hypothetical protein